MSLALRDRIEAAIGGLDGWCTPEKGVRLAELIGETDAALSVELGVFGGRGTIAMAIGHELLGKGHVVAVDPWDTAAALDGENAPWNDEWWAQIDLEAIYRTFVASVDRLGLASWCHIVRKRSEDAARLLADGSVDVLHQDSNHSEKVSVAEVELWTPKLRPRGLWVTDDVDWPTMARARALLLERGFTPIEDHGGWQVYRKAWRDRRALLVRRAAPGRDASVPSVHRRLLSRGDLPGSEGGVFNPGAVLDGSTIVLVARREVDPNGAADVEAELVRLDVDTLAVLEHRTLVKGPHVAGRRIEDFRCIQFDGMLLAVHSLVLSDRCIKPVISRVTETGLEPFDAFDLPIDLAPVEKNWVLFAHDGRLHCLYKLDPLTIFARTGRGTWELVKEEENGWADELPRTLSNSVNPIPFAGGYLGFWHTILGSRYVQGALLLGPDLEIAQRTDILLDGDRVKEGFKPGVLYVSALIPHRDTVLAIYGEGDWHTSVAAFDASALAAELARNPFHPLGAIRIRYDGRALGPFVRAMWAVRSFCASRPGATVRLYVTELRFRAIATTFKVPNLAVREQTRWVRYDYRLAEDTAPSAPAILDVADDFPRPRP